MIIMKNISEREIAKRGLYSVNLPVIFIIFASWFVLMSINLSIQRCAIISCIIGWIYWEFAIIKWIRWSLLKGIDKSTLYKIGKRNLLVWSEFKIDKVAEKLNAEK